jgi:hypothetical protein
MHTALTTPVEIELAVHGPSVEGRAKLATRRRTYEVEAPRRQARGRLDR